MLNLKYEVLKPDQDISSYSGYVGTKPERKQLSRPPIVEVYMPIFPAPAALNSTWETIKPILAANPYIDYQCLILNGSDKEMNAALLKDNTPGEELCITLKEGYNSSIEATHALKQTLLGCWSALKREQFTLVDIDYEPAHQALEAGCAIPFYYQVYTSEGLPIDDAQGSLNPLRNNKITAEDLRKHDLSFADTRPVQMMQIAAVEAKNQKLEESIKKQLTYLQDLESKSGEQQLQEALASITQWIKEQKPADDKTEDRKQNPDFSSLLLLITSAMAQIPLAAKEKADAFFDAANNAMFYPTKENLTALAATIEILQNFNQSSSIRLQEGLFGVGADSPRKILINRLIEKVEKPGDAAGKYIKDYLNSPWNDASMTISLWAEKAPEQFEELCSNIEKLAANKTLLSRLRAETSLSGRLTSWFKNNKLFTMAIALLAAALGVAFPPMILLAFIPLLAVAISPTLRTVVQAHPYLATVFMILAIASIIVPPLLVVSGVSLKLGFLGSFVEFVNVLPSGWLALGKVASALAMFTSALWTSLAVIAGVVGGVWTKYPNSASAVPPTNSETDPLDSSDRDIRPDSSSVTTAPPPTPTLHADSKAILSSSDVTRSSASQTAPTASFPRTHSSNSLDLSNKGLAEHRLTGRTSSAPARTSSVLQERTVADLLSTIGTTPRPTMNNTSETNTLERTPLLGQTTIDAQGLSF